MSTERDFTYTLEDRKNQGWGIGKEFPKYSRSCQIIIKYRYGRGELGEMDFFLILPFALLNLSEIK